MQHFIFLTILIFTAQLFGQDENSQVKRKVYRTQTGSIIEAPQPLFERARKKNLIKNKKNVAKVPKMLKRTDKVETTYRNELDSLKRTVQSLLNQSKLLQILLKSL